jgi:hypothetical protein
MEVFASSRADCSVTDDYEEARKAGRVAPNPILLLLSWLPHRSGGPAAA